MKNKILSYSLIVSVLLILQSCVSNYAVIVPEVKTSLEKIDEPKMAEVSTMDNLNNVQVVKKDIVIKADNKEILASIEKEMKKANTIDGILNEASSYIGTPYRLGGMSRKGIDCSAFVLSVYGTAAGIDLPRVSAAQAQEGERVEKADVEKGDLLFFQTSGKRISHVGIVQEVTPEGEIKFIHASTSKGVTISSLNEKYWGARYRFAKRILTDDSEEVL